MSKRKKKFSLALSSFTIIILLIFVLGILSHLLPGAQFKGEEIVNGSGVVGAKLSEILLSPILGFADAVDVSIFVMILGGFLAIINSTGALETGIQVLIKKLKEMTIPMSLADCKTLRKWHLLKIKKLWKK